MQVINGKIHSALKKESTNLKIRNGVGNWIQTDGQFGVMIGVTE